jgi:hypothetical protein
MDRLCNMSRNKTKIFVKPHINNMAIKFSNSSISIKCKSKQSNFNLFIITGYSMPQMAKSFTKSREKPPIAPPLREVPIDPL